MATKIVSELIRQGYELAQIWDPGEENEGIAAVEGLETLNTLIDEWSQMGTFIPAYNTITFSLTSGQYLKSVTPNITQVLEANIVDTSNTKYLLKEANLQIFNTFNFETIKSRPTYFYFSADMTDIQNKTNLYFYPKANASYTATLYVKQVLSEVAYSDVITNLPLFYFKALKYQLAKDLSDIYLTVLSPRFDDEYQKIISNLKSTNRKDLSVQNSNPFNGQRRYRPWNIYVG